MRLLGEIADSSAAVDLGTKAGRHVAVGIRKYWVVDLNARVIHQMWAPVGETYAKRSVVEFGEALSANTIDGLAIDTGGL